MQERLIVMVLSSVFIGSLAGVLMGSRSGNAYINAGIGALVGLVVGWLAVVARRSAASKK